MKHYHQVKGKHKKHALILSVLQTFTPLARGCGEFTAETLLYTKTPTPWAVYSLTC